MSTQLILNKRGTSLSVRNGMFLIRTPEFEKTVATHLVKSICLHPSTKLTHEVVQITIQEQIDLLFFDKKGFPIGRIWSNKFGSISTIRKNQILFAKSEKAHSWVRELILRKSNNQKMMVKILQGWDPILEDPANEILLKMNKYHQKIEELPLHDRSEFFASLRGIEGIISKLYFGFISQSLPRSLQFERRSQRPAKDKFNAMLNYTYGMLYGQVESALIRAGIDPYLGIFHRDEYNRPVLGYDFIENYRVWADYVVCHLCFQEIIEDTFFSVKDGIYWIESEGKRILITAMNSYLAEIVEIGGLRRSRQTHIDLDAQNFASTLKQFVGDDA